MQSQTERASFDYVMLAAVVLLGLLGALLALFSLVTFWDWGSSVLH
jgi:hypothetical protein